MNSIERRAIEGAIRDSFVAPDHTGLSYGDVNDLDIAAFWTYFEEVKKVLYEGGP